MKEFWKSVLRHGALRMRVRVRAHVYMCWLLNNVQLKLNILLCFLQPIPYWLYKLHGLNISYTCEICGNYTYKGPKAFQRHFAEWRHAHGMRCLGIPNTAHFANVTQIEDALACKYKLIIIRNNGYHRPHPWRPTFV